MAVEVEIFRDLDAVEAAAGTGLTRSAQPSLFDRLDWFRAVTAHCPPTGRPLVALARGNGCDAWLMLSEGSRQRATGLASWYTLAFAPIFSDQCEATERVALLTAIARALARGTATIALDHVPPGAAALLESAFRQGGWVVDVAPQTANWTIDVAGKDFATFWAERPGQLRSTAKRKAAKTPMDLQVFDWFDGKAWDDYADIYADSWKPTEGSLAFLRALAEREGAAGALRLGIARMGGRAVAAQLWTVEHGVAIIHKLAHRQDVAELSPGTILSKAMFAHVIDRDRVSLIDFGTGDDRYKADWMDTRVMRMRIVCYNPLTPYGVAALVRARAARLVRRFRSR